MDELAALGWSAEQLIARTNQVRVRRGSAPLHCKSAYPWLRGKCPSLDPMADVLTVLSQYSGRSLTASDLGWDRSRRQPSLHPLDNPYEATATVLLRGTQGDVPMQRRTFVLLSGAAVTAPALDLLMNGAGPLRAALAGDRVSAHLAETVERSVHQARALDVSEGSTPVLLWAGGLWQNLGGILTESRYRTTEAIRLHTAYIEMSETYGWMLFDAVKHPQAQRVYQIGLRLAHEAEDHPDVHRAVANLLASAAYQESWLGQHHEAETLLNVARTRRPEAHTPRLRAVLADREITIAGRQGDSEGVRRAEDQARENLDTARDEGPWWAEWLSPHDVDAAVGSAWLRSHRADLAEPYLARRLAVAGDSYPRDRMLFASELAQARLQNRDIPGACAATHHALDLAADVASPRVHRHLNTVTAILHNRHGTHPHVRGVLSRIPQTDASTRA